MSVNDQFDVPPAGPRRPRGPLVWPVAFLIVLAVVAAIVYLVGFRGCGEPEPAVEPEPAAPVAAPTPAAPPPPAAEPLPALDASDELVRRLVAELSSEPRLLTWLAQDGLVRLFVVSVANVAEGVSPTRHLGFLRPEEGFTAAAGPGGPRVDPASYRRYDRAAALFASLDAEGVAEAFRRLEPLLDEAYRDLGYPQRRFRQTLADAIRELLAVPRTSGPLELEEGVRSYSYADAELEGLSAAQKQLLRMGPTNVARVQEKLRAIARELDID